MLAVALLPRPVFPTSNKLRLRIFDLGGVPMATLGVNRIIYKLENLEMNISRRAVKLASR